MSATPWTCTTREALAVGLVVLSAASVALHHQVRTATEDTDRSLAASDLAPFVQDLRQNPDELPDEPTRGVLVGIRADGRWVVDTLPRGVREALPTTAGTSGPTDGRPQGDGDRVATREVRADGRTYVVAGQQVGDTPGQETIRRVDRSLVVGTLLAVAAFAGTAWVLTGLALRPVARMRRRAEDLGDGGADGHLPVGPAEDELAALARTLNRFVDRQHENAARERRMVSDAAHELRTPLAALTARLELAHRHSGDAPALEGDLTAAERDAARLSALAASLLELSRLDDGADEHVTSTADELVSELMASVDRARALPEAVTTEVDFVTAVPDGDARYAIGRSAFARVVDNLTANALAAATGGSVQVDLAQRDDELVLRVLDDGPGVPDAFLPHAFERFARADASRNSALGGSGLGLALVRGTAERAGGSATLRNRETGGAEAEVRLPRR
ncbi:HAMP domain-containing histidine kinase [Curtobacterium sp. Csp1]|uniref:sensor histidine kinase n=1 Tax=Curtobacterium sp. Csp1 TaxID=2495429 RepID=UPI0015995EA2|nr:HAMP domain-containing sensor histidine kinase [Curtobacterium sp. Csp1]QKS21746.1 HAMP domain-containing histidine kinase [Curtobacterium sp. Csp1]